MPDFCLSTGRTCRRQSLSGMTVPQLLLLALAVLLAGCAAPARNIGESAPATVSRVGADGPGHHHLVEEAREPVPRELPRSRYGNPKVYEVLGKSYRTMDSAKGYRERGNASWYGSKFHGRLTSSREVYDMYQLTAAHRSLPIPTFVEVTNLDNGKSIIAKVNDRGPFHDDRIIDLSYAAAVKLDMIKHGTAPVEVRAIDPAREASQAGGEPVAPLVKPTASPTISNITPDEPATAQAPGDGIYVQLGAFAQMTNAESMRTRVLQIIPAAAVNILPSEARGLYHVQLGPLRSRELVIDVLAELNRAGVTSYQLLSY
ncbi:MAG: septal ring lytic transglycosylase RlpA family protein [Gammaproteobacteria bacterium]|nr:septal ring lytic transglycosylase RlpA family protein [Gammaproteobacteria bacterium]